MVDLITPDQLIPKPHELVLRNGAPDTIAEWKALADGLLTNQSCAFHRNLEISSRYAWIYKSLPACLKWAGMAAFASHHVRLALFPLRLDTDRTGYVDIPHSLGRQKALLIEDVNTIRETNNAIFDDIFWVHLAYVTAEDGIERLRAVLGAEPHYAAVLRGFETIDQGRRVLEDGTASPEAQRTADDLIWVGNVQLLEHEQRALVQPNLDRLSCAFARLFSIGSALTFEVRGVRQEVSYFTSFWGRGGVFGGGGGRGGGRGVWWVRGRVGRGPGVVAVCVAVARSRALRRVHRRAVRLLCVCAGGAWRAGPRAVVSCWRRRRVPVAGAPVAGGLAAPRACWSRLVSRPRRCCRWCSAGRPRRRQLRAGGVVADLAPAAAAAWPAAGARRRRLRAAPGALLVGPRVLRRRWAAGGVTSRRAIRGPGRRFTGVHRCAIGPRRPASCAPRAALLTWRARGVLTGVLAARRVARASLLAGARRDGRRRRGAPAARVARVGLPHLYSLTRGIPQVVHARGWPRITRFDDRWRWIATSIVPRFRRFDADMRLADASLRRIFDEARDYASNPCVLPLSPQTSESAPKDEQGQAMATSL